MNVRHTEEIRITRAVYLSGGDLGLNMSVTGPTSTGWCTEGATSVKIVALRDGRYSIRCVGKGGFAGVRYVKGTDFMVLVSVGGENFRTGFVSAMYERTRRESLVANHLKD